MLRFTFETFNFSSTKLVTEKISSFVLILCSCLSERLRCWSIAHISDTTADRNKSCCNHSFANCYTQDTVQMKICAVLYFAVSVMIGLLVLFLKIILADCYVYCHTSWKRHSKFTFYMLCFFPHLAHIHMWIGYHWPDTVKFLPEFYPVVQFWGNTQTYQHSAHSVTSDLFYLWCISDVFNIWYKFIL
jgi:hypothetical protein